MRGRQVPWWIRVPATVALLGVIAWQVDVREMMQAFVRARGLPMLAAAALVLPNMLGAGMAWWFIARRVDPSVSYGESVRAVLGSHALGFWTPGRVGVFAGRGWMHERGEGWTWAAAVSLEALLGYGPPLLLGFGALWILDPSPVELWRTIRFVLGVAAVPLVFLILRPGILYGWLVTRWERPAFAFLQHVRPADLAAAMTVNALRLLNSALQLGLLATAFGAGGPLSILVVAGVATLAVKNVIPSFTIADLGIREGAAALFFASLGVAPAIAVDAALSLYVLNVLVPALVGWVFVAGRR